MRPELSLKPPQAGRSPFYRVRGSYLGQSVDVTTRTAERKVAQKILVKIKDEIERGVFAKSTGPTFMSAVAAYLDWKPDLAEHNRKFIRALVLHFGATPLDKMDQAGIDKAAATLLPNARPATRNREIYTPVSAILQHAGIDIALKRPEGAQGAPRSHWLRPDQAAKFLVKAWELHPRFAAFCTFLLYTGCRLSEGTRLQIEDLHLEEGFAVIGITKNGDPRGVHLPPVVVQAIRLALLEPGNASWKKLKAKAEIRTSGSVFCLTKSGALYNLLAAVETESEVFIPAGVSFHVFRHTYGAWMRRYGGVGRLEETGAWASRAGAKAYDHYDVSETARRADHLPGASAGVSAPLKLTEGGNAS